MLGVGRPASADDNLLLNANLRAAEGDHPSHWISHGWRSGHGDENFSWKPDPSGGNGQLGITINQRYDIATWSQTVATSPGWYCLRGEIRASGLRPNRDSGLMGVKAHGQSFGWWADPLRPDQWSEGTFCFKVGGPVEEVSIVCELMGLNASVACRNLSLTRLNSQPPPGTQARDLQAEAATELARGQALGLTPYGPEVDRDRVSFTVPTQKWSWVEAIVLFTILLGSALLIFAVSLSSLRGTWREGFLLIANRRVALFAIFIALVAAYIRLSFVFAKNSDDAIFVLQAQNILRGNFLLSGWAQGAESFYTTIIPFYLAGGRS